MGRNLTLHLPEEMIRSAKIMAIQQNKSLSQLLREYFEQMILPQTAYRRSMARILARTQKGLYSLKARSWRREDLYER